MRLPQALKRMASPDKGLPWATLLAVVSTGFCTFVSLYATQPVLPLFETLFAASRARVGLTIGVSTGAVALAAPLMGGLADRLPRKKLIVSASFALAAVTLLAACASTLSSLLVWRFLQGACIACVYVSTLAYITEEAAPNALGQTLSAFVSGNVLGGFFGRMVAAWTAESRGWPAIFWVLGCITLVGAAINWRFLPLPRRTPKKAPGPLFSWPNRERRQALWQPPLLATFAIGFNVLFCQVAVFTYAVFYLSGAPFYLSANEVGGVFSVYLVGAVITPVAGRLIDRYGSRLVLTATLLAGVCGASLTCASQLSLVVAGLGICCTCTFVCQAAATAYLRRAAPSAVRSLAAGLYTTAYYSGGSVGGVLPGLLWARHGWLGCVLCVVLVQTATLIVALFCWQSGRALPSQSTNV